MEELQEAFETIGQYTLWFGNVGTKLDGAGNVYTVYRDAYKDFKPYEPDVIAIYQSILRELGFEITVEEHDSGAWASYHNRYVRVIHTISAPPQGFHFYGRKSFGYEFINGGEWDQRTLDRLRDWNGYPEEARRFGRVPSPEYY